MRGSVHIYEANLDPNRANYTMGELENQARPYQSPEAIVVMGKCIGGHTAYRGLIRSTDVANAAIPPVNAVAPGGLKIAASAKTRKPAGVGKRQTWAAGPNPPYTNPGTAMYLGTVAQKVAQYAVDEILDSVVLDQNTVPQVVEEDVQGVYYQVRWSGWPPDANWYPAKDFQNCPAKLQEFHNRNPNNPRPANLNRWHRSYIRGTMEPGTDLKSPLSSGRV